MSFAQIQTIPEVLAIAKVIVLSGISFMVAMILTPIMTHFLYKYKIGIRIKDTSVQGDKLSFVNKLHAHKKGTPTMGGILIWFTVIFLALFLSFLAPLLSQLLDNVWVGRLNFLSRSQTWLPLAALFCTAILGLFDDYMSIRKIGNNKGGGMRFLWRFIWLMLIASIGAYWFHFKLGWDIIHIPALGDFKIGLWYLPLFALVILFLANASNITDGLDGLNAGILIQAFVAMSIISFFQHRMDLAAFCGVVAGALMAFLWFNFYPARFIMGDTGAFSLGATLAVVAMLLNSAVVVPLVVSIYFIEAFSVMIQLFSKKFFHRKVFLAAPIHHHFEAIGWPETKVTVRFWILNATVCILGILVGILGSGR